MSHRQTLFDHAAKVLVVVAAVVFVAPIVWLAITAVRQPSELFSFALFFSPTLENFASVLRSYNMGQFFANSVLIATVVTVVNIIVGGLAAYAFARFKFRFSNILFVSILCVRMIPSVSLIVPLYLMFASGGLLNTLGAVMITEIAFALPLSVWIMEGFFRALPRELEEAAVIDGCSRLGALIRIVVPLAMPGISVTAIFAFLSSWYSFLVPLVIISSQDKQTLPLALSQMNLLYGIRWDQMSAASIMYIVPTVIIAIVFQKYIVSGLTMGGVKG